MSKPLRIAIIVNTYSMELGERIQRNLSVYLHRSGYPNVPLNVQWCDVGNMAGIGLRLEGDTDNIDVLDFHVTVQDYLGYSLEMIHWEPKVLQGYYTNKKTPPNE